MPTGAAGSASSSTPPSLVRARTPMEPMPVLPASQAVLDGPPPSLLAPPLHHPSPPATPSSPSPPTAALVLSHCPPSTAGVLLVMPTLTLLSGTLAVLLPTRREGRIRTLPLVRPLPKSPLVLLAVGIWNSGAAAVGPAHVGPKALIPLPPSPEETPSPAVPREPHGRVHCQSPPQVLLPPAPQIIAASLLADCIQLYLPGRG